MTFYWVALALVVIWTGWRMVAGFTSHARLMGEIEAEGLLRRAAWAPVTMNFPMIKRITLCRIVLSRRRLVLFHLLTRGKILQAPLGPEGSAGKEEGRFEVQGSWLVFRTTMRGGGRIRMRVGDAKGWCRDIASN
jgi:hypothetical protein